MAGLPVLLIFWQGGAELEDRFATPTCICIVSDVICNY